MPKHLVVLGIGSETEALHVSPVSGVVVLVAPTTRVAIEHINGPENIGAIVVSDGVDIQEHITFVATVRPYFRGPIIAVGSDDGIELALMSAGCTHRVDAWTDVSPLLQRLVLRS